MNVDSIIKEQRLSIDSHYEKFAGIFCNLTGAKTSLTKERFLLGAWYEGYIYTLLLGIRINQRDKDIGKRENKTSYWSDNYLKQYKYAISLLLSRNDILNELNILDYQSIVNSGSNIKEILGALLTICNEFSNGGLKILSQRYEKDNTIFNDYNSLEKIMKDVITKM